MNFYTLTQGSRVKNPDTYKLHTSKLDDRFGSQNTESWGLTVL